MNQFYKPGMPGFNVIVEEAASERALIIIDSDRSADSLPVYWGSHELGSLTPKEREARDKIFDQIARARGMISAEEHNQAVEAAAAQARTPKVLFFLIGLAGFLLGASALALFLL